MTNAPFVELWANGQPLGSLVKATDGKVSLRVRIQAAPWVDVTQARLVYGSDGHTEDLPLEPGPEGAVLRADLVLDKTLDHDEFIVVEVEGERGLWPAATPREIPSINLEDALGTIAATLGLNLSQRPEYIGPLKPYALTNPVFIDVDGDGICYAKGSPGIPQPQTR